MGHRESSETEVGSKKQTGKRTAKTETKSEPSGEASGTKRKRGPGEVVLLNSKAEYARYESLEVRQKAVERAKRSIYAHLHEITNAHINLSVGKGNCQSAKFLFEFAGIDELPALSLVKSAQQKAGDEVASAATHEEHGGADRDRCRDRINDVKGESISPREAAKQGSSFGPGRFTFAG